MLNRLNVSCLIKNTRLLVNLTVRNKHITKAPHGLQITWVGWVWLNQLAYVFVKIPLMFPVAGLAYEVSVDLALEAGLRWDLTAKGSKGPFIAAQSYISPFVGATLYY